MVVRAKAHTDAPSQIQIGNKMAKVETMRIKILIRKNLKMTPLKVAAQAVHAALGLSKEAQLDSGVSVVVLGVSDKKFEEAVTANECNYVVHDAGYTEVPAGTQTCVAFLEEDPRDSPRATDEEANNAHAE